MRCPLRQTSLTFTLHMEVYDLPTNISSYITVVFFGSVLKWDIAVPQRWVIFRSICLTNTKPISYMNANQPCGNIKQDNCMDFLLPNECDCIKWKLMTVDCFFLAVEKKAFLMSHFGKVTVRYVETFFAWYTVLNCEYVSCLSSKQWPPLVIGTSCSRNQFGVFWWVKMVKSKEMPLPMEICLWFSKGAF